MDENEKCTHATRVMRLHDMLKNKPFVTIEEAQQKFGICRKTVYNDIKALETAGVPVYSTRVDGVARWTVERTALRNGLAIGEGQVLPLALTHLAFAFLEGTDLHDQLVAIHQKLAEGATPTTKKRLEESKRKLAIVPHGPKIYRDKVDALEEILSGLLYDHRVKIVYRSAGSTRSKTHVVEPLTLVLYREALYVIAQSQKFPGRLCFAIDRILSAERLKNERFKYPDDYDPKDFFDGSFGLLGGEPTKVELIFEADQARYVRERHWHPTQRFKNLSDGRVRMTMEVRGTSDVLLWLLGHTGTFEVIQPAELKRQVKERLKAGLKQHKA